MARNWKSNEATRRARALVIGAVASGTLIIGPFGLAPQAAAACESATQAGGSECQTPLEQTPDVLSTKATLEAKKAELQAKTAEIDTLNAAAEAAAEVFAPLRPSDPGFEQSLYRMREIREALTKARWFAKQTEDEVKDAENHDNSALKPAPVDEDAALVKAAWAAEPGARTPEQTLALYKADVKAKKALLDEGNTRLDSLNAAVAAAQSEFAPEGKAPTVDDPQYDVKLKKLQDALQRRDLARKEVEDIREKLAATEHEYDSAQQKTHVDKGAALLKGAWAVEEWARTPEQKNAIQKYWLDYKKSQLDEETTNLTTYEADVEAARKEFAPEGTPLPPEDPHHDEKLKKLQDALGRRDIARSRAMDFEEQFKAAEKDYDSTLKKVDEEVKADRAEALHAIAEKERTAINEFGAGSTPSGSNALLPRLRVPAGRDALTQTPDGIRDTPGTDPDVTQIRPGDSDVMTEPADTGETAMGDSATPADVGEDSSISATSNSDTE